MSFDKMARELLMPIYDRIQVLERDAASMQKVVGQMALGEKAGEPQFSREELETLKFYVIDCTGHSSGERREKLRNVAARLNQLLT